MTPVAERKLEDAIEELPKYWTADELASRVDLPPEKVADFLEQKPDLARRVPAANQDGKQVFTSAHHGIGGKELLLVLRAALSRWG